MALKMDRQVDAVELSYFLNETADRGVIVSVSNSGSGVAMEDPQNIATVAANSSGSKPIGMLLTDFVNLDLTRQTVNWHKDQAQVGDKAAIMTKGWAITDKITGTPAPLDFAVLGSSGYIDCITAANQTKVTGWSKTQNPELGRFRSKKNEDGYAKVYIDL